MQEGLLTVYAISKLSMYYIQRQSLKPHNRLRACIVYAHKLGDAAGQLGIPAATEEFAEAKLEYAQMLCVHVNRVYTKATPQATDKAERLYGLF